MPSPCHVLPCLAPRLMTDEPNKNGEEGDQQEDDVFLKKIESSMLSQVKLQGIEGIRKVSLPGSREEGLPLGVHGVTWRAKELMQQLLGRPLQRGRAMPRALLGSRAAALLLRCWCAAQPRAGVRQPAPPAAPAHRHPGLPA